MSSLTTFIYSFVRQSPSVSAFRASTPFLSVRQNCGRINNVRLAGLACLWLLLGLIGVVAPRQAWAYPQFQAVVTEAYHPKAGGTVAGKLQSCLLCHLVAGQAKFNGYGTDVKVMLEAAHTKTLTAAMLHTIDSKDSDGDGFDNQAEFAADMLPGDSTSKPAGTPPTKAGAAAGMTGASTAAANPGGDSSSNPYDLHTLLLPKHAQHPVLVHFPIALFVISLFFDALALWKRDKMLAGAGYLNLTVAAVTSLLALTTGLLAWNFAYGGISLAALQRDATLEQHLILSIITTILIWVLWGMRFSKRHEGFQTVKRTYMVLAVIAFVIISITGHLGGYLSGVN